MHELHLGLWWKHSCVCVHWISGDDWYKTLKINENKVNLGTRELLKEIMTFINFFLWFILRYYDLLKIQKFHFSLRSMVSSTNTWVDDLSKYLCSTLKPIRYNLHDTTKHLCDLSKNFVINHQNVYTLVFWYKSRQLTNDKLINDITKSRKCPMNINLIAKSFTRCLNSFAVTLKEV